MLPWRCLGTFPQEQDNQETPEKHKERSHENTAKNTLLEREAHTNHEWVGRDGEGLTTHLAACCPVLHGGAAIPGFQFSKQRF